MNTSMPNPVLLPDSVYEVRILNTRQGTISGYYDDFDQLAIDAGKYDGHVPAIYTTLNPVKPALLARAHNRLADRVKTTTSNPDILVRAYLLIDCDAVRPSGISSTESEHQAALDRAMTIQGWLTGRGWPDPIVADSGNGGHLLYKIDLPNDAASTTLVKTVLEMLAFTFDDAVVVVDKTVFNPARITKLYGSMACKGDSTLDRPHRQSAILSIPDPIETVSTALLTDLAAQLPREPRAGQSHLRQGQVFDLTEFMTRHALQVSREKPWNGGTVFELETCPFNAEHVRSSSVIQFPSGAMAFSCLHNSCHGQDWRELRSRLEPDRKVRPAIAPSKITAPGDGHAAPMPTDLGQDPKKTELSVKVWSIRLDSTLKMFEKKREIATLILDDLDQHGSLIRAHTDDLYYFDATTKTLLPLESEDFCSPLYRKFGLNATEEEARFVARELTTEAMTEGTQANVHRLSYWDKTTSTLYVSNHDGTLMQLTGETITQVDNGTGGALFLTDPDATPVKPNLAARSDAFHTIFNNLSLLGDAQHCQRMLAVLKVWVLALFFYDAIPVRPIVLLWGEQGSGKTTLGRRIGRLLFGQAFDVGSFKSDASAEQDFLAAITATRFLVFDNADTRISWLPDHLAKLATGSAIPRRRLYTTNELVKFRPDAMLMMTSRDPKWTRDDVARRLIPITMATISGGKIREEELQLDIAEHRVDIWGAILHLLNDIVAAMRQPQASFRSHHRLADFHWFGSLAAPALGLAAEFEDAMHHLNEVQLDVLADGNEQLELLRLWFDSKPDVWEASVTAAAVLKELRPLHEGTDRTFPFKTSTAIGTWIGRNKDLIHAKLKVTVGYDHKTNSRSWCFAKTRCHGVIEEKALNNQGVTNPDTMTPRQPKAVHPSDSGGILYAEDAIEEEVIDEA